MVGDFLRLEKVIIALNRTCSIIKHKSLTIYHDKGRKIGMNIVCLDMEGVRVPEIWIEFANESGIPELKKTTRDEPDYDKLMKYRLDILKEHGLGLKEIQETIARIDPLPGRSEERRVGKECRSRWSPYH